MLLLYVRFVILASVFFVARLQKNMPISANLTFSYFVYIFYIKYFCLPHENSLFSFYILFSYELHVYVYKHICYTTLVV